MIWIFILAVGLALVLIKLGALSVWVSIMAIGLKVAFLILVVGVAAVLLRQIYQKNKN